MKDLVFNVDSLANGAAFYAPAENHKLMVHDSIRINFKYGISIYKNIVRTPTTQG